MERHAGVEGTLYELREHAAARRGTRLLLSDMWTNLAHTEPRFAALMAGEFLVVGGNGEVYSIEQVRSWLDQKRWRLVEHKLLGRPASLVIAEATGEWRHSS